MILTMAREVNSYGCGLNKNVYVKYNQRGVKTKSYDYDAFGNMPPGVLDQIRRILRPRLPEQAVLLFKNGMNRRKIASIVGVTPYIAGRWIKAWQEGGRIKGS